MALCKESPYDLIDILGLIAVNLQPWHFYRVKFTNASSDNEKNHKNAPIVWLFLESKSFKFVLYAWYHEFFKVGTFFWLTRYANPRQFILGSLEAT